MTQRQKENLFIWALTIGLSAGVAWGTSTYRLGAVESKVDRIDQRVGKMYCAQVPDKLKDACQ